MLSLLDVILERKMESILDGLHLEQDLYNALVTGTGRMGVLMTLTSAYEQGDWPTVDKICAALSLNVQDLPPLMAIAIETASQIYFGD
jgi:c-di-GMP-related signal transduction protein